MARSTLHGPNGLGVGTQVERVVARTHYGFMHLHVQVAHRKQRARIREHLVVLRVRRHSAGNVEDCQVWIDGPQERDHRQIQGRHCVHLNGRAARLGDPLHHPEFSVERSVRVDFDHHLEPRLHDIARNLRVRGLRETALIHYGRDGCGLARDVLHQRLPAIEEETGPDRRNTCSRGALGRHEHAEQRFFASHQRDGELP